MKGYLQQLWINSCKKNFSVPSPSSQLMTNTHTQTFIHVVNKNNSYFFFLDEAISTLRMTNTLATERRNLIVTAIASSLRPGVYLFCSSFTRVPSKVSKSYGNSNIL